MKGWNKSKHRLSKTFLVMPRQIRRQLGNSKAHMKSTLRPMVKCDSPDLQGETAI